jgi:hypothetical protein
MTSASIVPYPTCAAVSGLLSFRDKVDVCRWEVAHSLPRISRVVIFDRVETDAGTVDFVLVYGADSPWARWGLARRGGAVTLWRCSDGDDLGVFETMAEALAALERHASVQRPIKVARGNQAEC